MMSSMSHGTTGTAAAAVAACIPSSVCGGEADRSCSGAWAWGWGSALGIVSLAALAAAAPPPCASRSSSLSAVSSLGVDSMECVLELEWTPLQLLLPSSRVGLLSLDDEADGAATTPTRLPPAGGDG